MLRNKLLFLTCLLIGSQLILPAFAGKQYTTYFQSWSEKWGSKGSDLTLANLPSYVNTVILSFMKPDNAYTSGSMALSGAGLDFSSDGSVVKDAIGIAKSNGAKVLVAVGGATYTNWDGLNEAGIAAFVKDFGLDGVDIDYEPANAGCTQSGGTVQCAVDKQFQDVVSRIRKAVPSPAFVSLAGWSIGAYGEGSFQSAQPQGDNTGLCVNLLKSDAGKCLDQINIMSYDAGSTFDPKQAFQAYRSLFGGKLALGLEIPPEAWGGHVLSISEVDTLCDFVNQNGADGDGMMLWSLNKKPDGAASASNPDATMVSQEVCKKLGLSGCDKPLPTALGMKVGETSDIFEVIAALNAEKDIWVEHTFGAKRDEMLAKVIANLNREKDMWLSHYMRGLALNEMMVSPQNKMDEDLSLLKTLWDDVRNARIEQHLKGEKVYNDLHELLVALNEEEKLWLAFYSRGKARAGVHVEGRSVEGLPDVMVGLSRSVGSLEDIPETFVEKANTGRRYFRSGLGVAQF